MAALAREGSSATRAREEATDFMVFSKRWSKRSVVGVRAVSIETRLARVKRAIGVCEEITRLAKDAALLYRSCTLSSPRASAPHSMWTTRRGISSPSIRQCVQKRTSPLQSPTARRSARRLFTGRRRVACRFVHCPRSIWTFHLDLLSRVCDGFLGQSRCV